MQFKTLITTAITAGTLVVGATAANADTGKVVVKDVNPGELVVMSNGNSYTQLKPIGNVSFQIRAEYEVGLAGRVKSWKVWPEVTNGFGIAAEVPSMKSFAYSKSYSVGNRPKKVDRTVNVTVPAMHLQTNAVNMCNLLANQMRSQGKSDKWIFGMDHHVTFEARANYEWNVSGPGSDDALFEVSWPHEFKVRCAKWGGAQVDTPDTLANAFHVKKATMKLEEKALKNGYCAVKLTTAVSTNTANKTFKYRYKHSSGKLSPIYSAKTKGNKIAVVSHTWDVPNKNGLERGWMQLVGVSHDFKSNRARYRMKCVDAPGGFAPNPQKPKVRVPLGGNGKLSN